MKRLSALLFSTLLILAACSPYEDGPGISFRSKCARLTGEWKLTKWMIDGQNQIGTLSEEDIFGNTRYVTTYTTNVEIEIEKDGDVKWLIIGNYTESEYNLATGQLIDSFSENYNQTWLGDWEWQEGKEDVEMKLNIDGDIYIYELQLKRLANKEMYGDLVFDGQVAEFEAEQ